MTVTFKDSNAVASDGVVHATLLSQLKPSAHADNAPVTVVRRVVTCALANGWPIARTRNWILHHIDSPAVRSFVSDPMSWNPEVTRLRKRLASASSPSSRHTARLAVVRRMVARVTSAVPDGLVSKRAEINARFALALIAKAQLNVGDGGAEKVMVTASYLAVHMNISVTSAQALLGVLEKKLGWIRRCGSSSGRLLWKFTELRGDLAEELDARALLLGATIDAVASGELEGDYLAQILDSADHEAWTFARLPDSEHPTSTLNARAWLALVHQHSGQPEAIGFGLVPRALRKVRRELEAELPGVLAGLPLSSETAVASTLIEALDAKSEATGAFVWRLQRENIAHAEAAANRARVEAFRAEKARIYEMRKDAGAVVKSLVSMGGVVKGAALPVDRKELEGWVPLAAGVVRERSFDTADSEWTGVARGFLAAEIIRRGHTQADSEKVAGFVFRDLSE